MALSFIILPMYELHQADTKSLTYFGKIFLFKLHRKLKVTRFMFFCHLSLYMFLFINKIIQQMNKKYF